MSLRSARWTWLLPSAILTFVGLLVVVPASLDAVALWSRPSDASGLVSVNQFISIQRNYVWTFACRHAAYRFSTLIRALNVPGALLLGVAGTVAHLPPSYEPANEYLTGVWHAMLFPTLCAPAWMLIGRSIEQQKLSRLITVVSSLLCLISLSLGFAFRLGTTAEERQGTGWLISGLFVWAFLLAIAPYRFLQLRRRWFRELSTDERASSPSSGQ